MDEAFLCLV
jgi:hypothetical protein